MWKFDAGIGSAAFLSGWPVLTFRMQIYQPDGIEIVAIRLMDIDQFCQLLEMTGEVVHQGCGSTSGKVNVMKSKSLHRCQAARYASCETAVSDLLRAARMAAVPSAMQRVKFGGAAHPHATCVRSKFLALPVWAQTGRSPRRGGPGRVLQALAGEVGPLRTLSSASDAAVRLPRSRRSLIDAVGRNPTEHEISTYLSISIACGPAVLLQQALHHLGSRRRRHGSSVLSAF